MSGITRERHSALLLTLTVLLLAASATSGQRNNDAIKSATEDDLVSELGEIPPETFLQRLSRAGAVMSDDEDERRPRGLLAALMGYPDDFEDVNPEDMKPTPSGRASIYSRAKGGSGSGGGKKLKSAKTTKAPELNATETTTTLISATTPEAVNKSIKREAIPTTSGAPAKVAAGSGQPIPAGYILWHPVPASFVESQMTASASAAAPTTASAAPGTGLPHQPFFFQPPQFADLASGFQLPPFPALPTTTVAGAPAKTKSKGRQRGSSSKKTPRPKTTRNKNRNKATTRPEVVETTPAQQFQQQQNDFRNGGPFFPQQQEQFPRPQQQFQGPQQFQQQNGGGQQFPQQQNGGQQFQQQQQFRNNLGPQQQQQQFAPQFQQNGPQQFGPSPNNRPQQQFPFSQPQQQQNGGQQFRNNPGPQQFQQNNRPQQQNGPAQQLGPQPNNRPQQNFAQNQFRAPQQGPNNFQQGQRFNGPQQQQQQRFPNQQRLPEVNGQRFPPQQQQQEVMGQQSQRLTQTQNNIQKPTNQAPTRQPERPFNMGHQFANFNNPNFQNPNGGAGGGPGFGPFFDGPMFNQFGGPNPFGGPSMEQMEQQRMRDNFMNNNQGPNFMEPPGMRFPFPPPLPPPPPPSPPGPQQSFRPDFFPPNSSPRPNTSGGQESRGLSPAAPQLPPPTQQNAIASASFAQPHFIPPLPGQHFQHPTSGGLFHTSPFPGFGFNPNLLNPIYSRDFLKSSTESSSSASPTGSTPQSESTVGSVSGKGSHLDREAVHKQRPFNNNNEGQSQFGLPLSQLQRFPGQTGNGNNFIPQNGNNFLPQNGNNFLPQNGNNFVPQNGNGNIFPPSPRPFADFPPPRPDGPFPPPPSGSPFAQFEHQLRKPEPDANHFRTSLPPVSSSVNPHLPNFNGDIEQKMTTSTTLRSLPELEAATSASPNTPHGNSYPSPGFHNGHKGFPSSVTAPHPTSGLHSVTSAPHTKASPEATNLTPFFVSSSTSGPVAFHYEVKYQTQAPPSQ